MVLYNVTVGIDTDVENEWLDWMKNTHIPAVMDTGMFIEYKIFKVLGQGEDENVSYSIQYFAKSIDQVLEYLDQYSQPLIAAHMEKYKDKHVAFRTLLQQV